MGMAPRDALLSLQSDEQLVMLAREGSDRAFAAIVERYRRELHAFAGRMRSDGRADDLVQQTFLSAFTALRAGTEVTHLRGWLYRILRNEATRAARQPVVEVALDPTFATSESLEESSQRRMLAFDALSSIAALPERQRQVLVASALGGESRAAVAGSMGLSEGAVRQLMHRARATLRAAAAAITPAPLANWAAALRDSPTTGQAPEVALGAGTGSAAAVALKLGAILASGAIATGVVSSELPARSTHRPAPPARTHSQRLSSSAQQSAAAVPVSAAGARGHGPGSAPAILGARGLGAPAVGVVRSGVGVAGGSARGDRTRRHERGSSEHRDGHARVIGGAGAGESRPSGGDGGSRSGQDGATGVDGRQSGGGGPATAQPTGGDGGQSRGSGGEQTPASGQSGSGDGGSSGVSGSSSSDGGHGGGSSGDVASTVTGSGDGGSSSPSSSDSSRGSTRGRDSSSSDSSGK